MLKTAESGSPEEWADRTPDAVAVRFGNRSLTYADWNERANRVAEGLANVGFSNGDRIGMRFRLGFMWFVVQRACQKLGVVQVTVNYRLTAEEALYILKDSGAKGLACDDDDPEAWLGLDIGVLLTEGAQPSRDWLRFEDLLADNRLVTRFGPARPQMVIYTSGTTGNPKGVPPADPPASSKEQQRLDSYLRSIARRPQRPEGRRVVMLSLPVHHGAGPLAATVATETGGTTVLLSPFDAEEALRLIEEHKVNMWTAVPTMLQRIRSLPEETLSKYDVSSMRTLVTGAAPVGSDLASWAVQHFGPVLWETYGLSEANMIGAVSPEDKIKKPGSSAKIHDGVQVSIIDSDWKELPFGEIGEIAVNTPLVLNNYIGKPPLDTGTLRDGFYRTGDVGYLDEDGYLYITDRMKDMIIAGGVNIYPAEIEKVLAAHDGVLSCAVIGIPHEEFGEQSLAFVVIAEGASVTEEELRVFVEDRLARYKHPRQYEFVAGLPLNPTGKVLKNKLREKYWIGHERNI